MDERRKTLIAAGAGLAWALALLVLAALFVRLPVFALMPTIMTAFLAPGLVLAAMIGRAALREGGDDGIAAAADIDRRAIRATVEQLVLAMAVWPAAAVMLGAQGPGVIVTLGAGFALARLAFWLGCHRSPPLRVFGAAATFCPTLLAALWALARLAV